MNDGEPNVAELGGVVFRVAEELCFLPGSIAMKVLPVPEMARIPGAPLELRGVALVDGEMIPVVEVTESASHEPSNAMLVCLLRGERVGLVGIDIVATGRFEAGESSGDVKFRGELARTFDVASVIAKVREGRWAV